MKALLIVATVFTLTITISALSPEEPDVADILSKLGLSSSKSIALKQSLGDQLADDDDAVATVMSNTLLKSLLESDQDGGDSIMATIMKSNEEEAEAQFRFIRNLFTRFRRSPFGQFVGQQLRNRFCTTSRG